MVEIGSNVRSQSKAKTDLTFEYDLWDQLQKISAYAKENAKNIAVFRDFNHNIAKLTSDFAIGLK